MKTKNKIVAIAEIAIVLCSVFLVATLPAIAAEQNQGMQKVSTNEVTTASEDDFVLGIYGNANEDDTINMGDVVYTKLAIFGKKPKTELCDAKYDGRINVLDVIQTKLIILGKEKELTLVDSKERIVTVKKPLKRIVSSQRLAIEMLKTLKVSTDRIVGVSSVMQRPGYENDILFPEFQDKPTVGNLWTPDVEAILNLNPDVVMLMAVHMGGSPTLNNAQNVLESAGIPVIRVYGGVWGKNLAEEVKKLGYVFGKQDEADEFVYFYNKHMDSIKEKVEKIPAENKHKPKVYFESSKSYSVVGDKHQDVEAAGGENIFEERGAVDPEAVIDRNPDIIVKVALLSASGYRLDSDDTTEIEKVKEEIMNRPELQNVKAVKEGRVYVISCRIVPWGPASIGACRALLQNAYLAKWFHPELFEDLDPKAIHQEYLTRFQGLDIDLDEKGVFAYPEPS